MPNMEVFVDEKRAYLDHSVRFAVWRRWRDSSEEGLNDGLGVGGSGLCRFKRSAGEG